MPPRNLKSSYLVVEGLNSFAIVFFFYYLYFFMQKVFGFDNSRNLMLAASTGAINMLASWWGGRFAQRFGYFTALKLGFFVMFAALSAETQVHALLAHLLLVGATVIGMSFTWPTLEALVSEGEDPEGVKHMVGMYNVVWAATGALAYFVGGAILETLGMKSLFYLPAAIILGELVLTFWLETKSTVHGPQSTVLSPKRGTSVERRVLAADDVSRITNHGLAAPKADEGGSRITSHASRITFQRLAWLANPFAYMAMNTIIAVIPGVAKRLELSAMLAGFCCSVWCFARLGAFIGLWYWDGWHYRFRWLLAAYLSVLATFATIVLAPNLAVLVGAQILFGSAVGLIYYSSLFYSMDTSETKGTHGGIHEAAIGLGNFVGPAVGAAWLYFLPQYANSGAVAVSGLLLAGLGGLLWTWQRGAGNRNPKSEAQQQGDR